MSESPSLSPSLSTPDLSRREFLRVSTLAGGGFVIGYALPGTAFGQAGNMLDNTARQFTPNPFIKITPETRLEHRASLGHVLPRG